MKTRRVELFRESAMAYLVTDEMFRVESWMQMMIGKRLMPRAYHHMGRMRGPERLRRAIESLQGSIAGAVAKMPTHREFLRACCPAPEILGSR